jgi:hypothetical protein
MPESNGVFCFVLFFQKASQLLEEFQDQQQSADCGGRREQTSPSLGPVLRSAVLAKHHCVGQLCIVTTDLKRHLREGQIDFGSRFQSMVGRLHDFGPETERSIMAAGVDGEGCSPHGG